jgi:hypothetical protein
MKKYSVEINIAIAIQTFLGVNRLYSHYCILVARIFGHVLKFINNTIPLSYSKNLLVCTAIFREDLGVNKLKTSAKNTLIRFRVDLKRNFK